jgi:hypothetical protein
MRGWTRQRLRLTLAFVEEQHSEGVLLLLVPSDRLAGTAGDARISERAGAESRKGIPETGHRSPHPLGYTT